MKLLSTVALSACQPLVLPGVAAGEAALSRRVGHGLVLPLPGLGAGGGLLVRPASGQAPLAMAACTGCSDPAAAQAPPWTLDGDHGPLWLGGDAPAWLAGLTGVDIRAAHGPAQRQWLQASLLAMLPPPWAGRFHTLAVAGAPPPAGLLAMRLVLRTADHLLTTHAWAAAQTWLACLADWPQRALGSRRTAWGHWAVREHVMVARHRLPAARARCLRRGDIVVPDQPLFDRHGAGRWPCALRLLRVQGHADCLEILDMLDPLHETPESTVAAEVEPAALASAPEATEAAPVPDEAPAGGFDGEPPPSALDRLPLQLEFSLGCVRGTLGELHALAPGTVLQLERRWAPGCVSIRVGERELGLGELVQVDGRLAVRITDWDLR